MLVIVMIITFTPITNRCILAGRKSSWGEVVVKEMIKWLIRVEQEAGELYRKAAIFFQEDKTLAAFLAELSEDEAWHFHVMRSAAECIRASQDMKPAQVALDPESRQKILSLFQENLKHLMTGRSKVEDIYSCIVTTEFSEWNDLFLYVVNTLKGESREFQYAAAKMQGHLDQIATFLETRPDALTSLERMRKIPQVWREKILVVEDSEPLRIMLQNILSRQYYLDTAEDGQQGLEKIKENYFDVILSDIEMPKVDGITMFQKALSYDPTIAHRFLFMSGYFSDKNMLFLETNHIPFMQKPVVLQEVGKKLTNIIVDNRRSVDDVVFSIR